MIVDLPPSQGELSEALSVATEVALEAGALLREALYTGATVSEVEANGEVHALADLNAERLIRARLTARFPTWGMRSEEEPELNRPPGDERQRFWLVDPNDGTSAFVKGERGASVSIALIERGAPVLGVIYAYMGLDDRGDLFTWARGCGPLHRNGEPLDPPTLWAERWEDVTVFVSNSADSIAQAYCEALQGARFRVAPGVAYRLALAASGEGDLATSLAGPRDFDYAAGHALLIGAGGRFVDERGRDVTYHPSRPERLGFGLGGAPGHVGRLLDLNWSAVLRREGQQRHELRRPRHSDLCPEPDLLTQALGAWWGWHLGWALSAGEEPAQLEASMEALCSPLRLTRAGLLRIEAKINQVGGDAELNAQLRRALAQKTESAWRPLEDHPLATIITQLAQGAPLCSPQERSPHTRSARCLKLAHLGTSMRSTCSDGGRTWPQRLIGALLSYREGDSDAWGSDSARLLEAWLTHLTHQHSSETGGKDGVQ